MNQPARCECAKCFNRTPKATSRPFEISVHSGDSYGVSWGKSSNSQRFSTRSYYRNKTIWLCQSCTAEFERFSEERSVVRRHNAHRSWKWTGAASGVLAFWGLAAAGTITPFVGIPLLVSACMYWPRSQLRGYLAGGAPTYQPRPASNHRPPPRLEDRREPRL